MSTSRNRCGAFCVRSSITPLNDISRTFCSTYISLDTSGVYATAIDLMLYISAVPTEHLEAFDSRLRESLTRIADEGFDMDRMALLLARDEQQASASLIP